MATVGNAFSNIPSDLPEELCEVLARGAGVRVERIVSRGHCSPEGFWHDQPHDEWVIVLAGSAILEFEGGETAHLGPGDHLEIHAHVRHRVTRTDSSTDTVWIAVHCGASGVE